MTDTANGVRVWGGAEALTTAHLLIAPLGTALPTDAKTSLDPAYADGGRVDENGVTYSPNFNVQEEKDMSGRVLRRICTTAKVSLGGAMAQWTAESLKTVFGANNVTVTEAGAITVKCGKKLPAKCCLVLNVKDGNDAMRIAAAEAQPMPGNFTIAPGSSTKPAVTFELDPDDDGVCAYIYSAGEGVE